MELIIKNKLIDVDAKDILDTLRTETGYKYFKSIKKPPLMRRFLGRGFF